MMIGSMMRVAVVAGMVTAGGAAMAQQQQMGWGPSQQQQYHQNWGSAPTYVSYGVPAPPVARSKALVQPAPVVAARPVAKASTPVTSARKATPVRAWSSAKPRTTTPAATYYRPPSTSGM